MKRIKLAAIVIVVIAIVSAGIWWLLQAASSQVSKDIMTSGFVEATNVAIAPETGGRIASISVSEGDRTSSGDVLVKLDDTLLKAQAAQAEAVVAQAQASVEQAQAAVEQAQALADQAAQSRNQVVTTREGARKAWENALDVQQHPLDLNAQLTAAQGQVDAATIAVSQALNSSQKLLYPYTYSTFAFDVPTSVGYMLQAQDDLNAIRGKLNTGLTPDEYAALTRQLQDAMDNLTKSTSLLSRGQGADVFQSGILKVGDFWTVRSAQLQVDQAQAALSTANKTLQIMQEKQNNPQQIIAAVDSARAAYDSSSAAVQVADSAVTTAQKQVGIAQKQVEVARRQVEQTQASLGVIKVQLGKMTITSPLSGTVTTRNAEAGEIASPGVPVMIIANLDTVTLTAYVPESQIGLVKLGQKALVSVDSYPGQDFTGSVSYISPQALFTPGNIQLKNEREKTVFPVKVSLPNPDRKLKAGMPADARIVIGQ